MFFLQASAICSGWNATAAYEHVLQHYSRAWGQEQKCQMHPNESGGGEFWEAVTVISRSGIEQRFPTHFSSLNFPSLPEEPWAIDTPEKCHGVSMLKNHFTPWNSFAPVHRCTVHPAKSKTKPRNCTFKYLWTCLCKRVWHTKADLLTNISLF